MNTFKQTYGLKRHSIWEQEPDTDLTQEIIRRPPCKLMLSLNGSCNLRCRHCMRALRPSLKGGPMGRTLLESIIECILPHTVAVRLGGNDYGEQLLGDNFGVFMEAFLSMERRPDLEITTNGILLTEEKADTLVRADAHVRLSIEGSGAEYSRVRGRRWDDFIQGIRFLECAKEAHHDSKAQVTLYICATLDSLDSIKELLRRPLPGIDSVEVRHFYTHHYRMAMQSLFYNRDLGNAFLGELRSLAEMSGLELKVPGAFESHHLDDAPDFFVGHEAAVRLPCHKPFELVSILSDGSVYPCCGTAPKLGTFTPEMKSIESIWNGAAFRYMRRIVNTKDARLDCKRCEDVQTEPGAFMVGFGSELIRDMPTKDDRTAGEKARHLIRRGFEKTQGAIKRLEWLLLGNKHPF